MPPPMRRLRIALMAVVLVSYLLSLLRNHNWEMKETTNAIRTEELVVIRDGPSKPQEDVIRPNHSSTLPTTTHSPTTTTPTTTTYLKQQPATNSPTIVKRFPSLMSTASVLDHITKSSRRVASYTGPQFTASFQTSLSDVPTSTFEFRSFGGWPLCVMTNVCIQELGRALYRRYHFGINPRVTETDTMQLHTTAFGRSCSPNSTHHTREGIPMYAPINSIGKNGEITDITWLRDTTFLVDTWVPDAQLDHVGSKALQFFALLRIATEAGWTTDEFASRIFMYLQSRYPSSRRPESKFTTHIVRFGLSPFYYNTNRSLYHDEFQNNRNKLICMERVVELSGVFERRVLNRAGLRTLQLALKDWAPSVGSNFQPLKCPPGNVVVLHRVEGQGLRKIINFAVLEEVLMELTGMLDYRNVSISQNSRHAEQIEVFSQFSLMISPHSSQLFNVVFSHPFAAVLEYRPCCEPEKTVDAMGGMKYWERIPSPFCPGLECGLIYNVTYHRGLRSNTYSTDVELDRNVFRDDLRGILLRQTIELQQGGCELPPYLVGFQERYVRK